MKRLTKKSNGYFIPAVGREDKEYLLWDKLGKLEELEAQIGCPLEVRCKLYDGALIYDNEENEYVIKVIDYNFFIAYCKKGEVRQSFDFNDYKKTWWLKEDISE